MDTPVRVMVAGLPQTSAAVPAERPWHAKLSALPVGGTAVVRTAAATTEPKKDKAGSKKGASGSSLAAGLVNVPLTLRSARGPLGVDRSGVAIVQRAGRWTLRPAPGHDGDYFVVAADGCGFLSAPKTGKKVELAPAGEGLQRWVVRQIGDSKYAVRVAGGKEDDNVYLGAREDGTVRLFESPKPATEWSLGLTCARGGDDDEKDDDEKDDDEKDDDDNDDDDDKEPPKESARTHVPANVPADIGELTERQIDAVLQLVSLPENGHPRWHENYGYVEFLGDGRGFTATLFGACSGTGDLHMILEELAKIPGRSATCDQLLAFKEAMKSKRGDDIRGIEPVKGLIKRLGDDPAWQRAVWKVYVKLYWRFAMDWAAKRGVAVSRPGPKLTWATSKGFMLDTAINHGADYGSFMRIVQRMATKDSKDEKTWLVAFADAREKMLKSGYDDLDTSRTGDRCRLWKQLVLDGNTQLATPIQAYRGYWGRYTVQ